MSDESRTRRLDMLRVTVPGFWFVGWLFTIGLVDLGVGRALLALVIWPYYIGVAIGH